MERQLVPALEARARIRVVNSRFIATAGPVFTVEEARAFIDRIEHEFEDASHHVPAYIVGHGASIIMHCSDNGEPSGTAGPPALAVLQGSDLGDVAAVVTRYFGGTKLGTGGLVRAYSDAVRAVLSVLPRAVKVPTHTVRVTIPYPMFERVRRVVKRLQGHVLDEVFAADVTMTAQLPQDAAAELQNTLQELSRGTIVADVIASSDSTIVPVPSD